MRLSVTNCEKQENTEVRLATRTMPAGRSVVIEKNPHPPEMVEMPCQHSLDRCGLCHDAGGREWPQIAPTMTAEQAANCQQWAGMDGATAYHLIERHAENWADINLMMGAWLAANREKPANSGEG